jgi:hypothetical protein
MKASASFEAALGEQHVTLGQELRRLEAALELSPLEQTKEAIRRLAWTQVKLRDHFAFEEQGGYMSLVLERFPNRHREVQELLAEHRQLAEALAALRETAEKTAPASPLDPALLQKIKDWIARVRQHEARENGLVQDSCNQDIYAED